MHTKLTISSTLAGLLFGYDTGVISGALLYLNDALQLKGRSLEEPEDQLRTGVIEKTAGSLSTSH